MPKIVVDDFGGQRSDVGMLGSGIYFASSARYEFLFGLYKLAWRQLPLLPERRISDFFFFSFRGAVGCTPARYRHVKLGFLSHVKTSEARAAT